jgi:uncharacterized cysteine cluster protein YcgN (CxxCxxCC family)
MIVGEAANCRRESPGVPFGKNSIHHRPMAPSKPLADERPFWRRKSLAEMSEEEWENLCDGCARCCLVKLEDEETGTVHYTDVGCMLLDAGACRCRDYENRQSQVPDCVRLAAANVAELSWLPPTCAYRLVAQGRDLHWWHPLRSGDPETVHQAGISVRGRVAGGEEEFSLAQLLDRVVQWPLSVRARKKNGSASS